MRTRSKGRKAANRAVRRTHSAGPKHAPARRARAGAAGGTANAGIVEATYGPEGR